MKTISRNEFEKESARTRKIFSKHNIQPMQAIILGIVAIGDDYDDGRLTKTEVQTMLQSVIRSIEYLTDSMSPH